MKDDPWRWYHTAGLMWWILGFICWFFELGWFAK